MTYTEHQIRSLTGRELWAAVEWLVRKDDLTANTDERISDSIGDGAELLRSDSAYIDIKFAWWDAEILIDKGNCPDGHDRCWYMWEHRHCQPWKSAIEQHVANWRAEPRNFGSLDVCVPLLMGEGGVLGAREGKRFAVGAVSGDEWRVWELVELMNPTEDVDPFPISEDPATAICRAACIVALREGE